MLIGAGIVAVAGFPRHGLAGVVAVGLCVPAAFGTFWLTKWMATRSPFGGLLGMAIGVPVRLIAALGGGMGFFFGTGWFDGLRAGFWFWLLGTYLLTLVAETVLLAVPTAAPAGGPRSERG